VPPAPPDPPHPYVSRGGLKLRAALDAFGLDVTGLRCADFGSSTGGFTDCLLRAGAARVTCVDTGYGVLAYRLRTDPRVAVRERENALHAPPPPEAERPELVVIDMAWTPQRLCVPAALGWLAPGGRVITLVKPHYELTKDEQRTLLVKGVLGEADAERITARVLGSMPALGARVLGSIKSPILGGGTRGKARGNAEWLALLEPATAR
jgi:23S rRNA (cytidine1920-2'-O)/16S rRNA (cytidine1409-2'-O)-methyltransferase